MNENSALFSRVQSIVSKVLGLSLEEVDLETSQENSIEWDSMSYLSIMSDIESEFDVLISEENINNFGSVRQIINEIKKFK
jgi:acyl carrier protein